MNAQVRPGLLAMFVIVVALAIAGGACSNPVGPKPTPSLTITGTVLSAVSPDLTVRVGASANFAQVSATGGFTLQNVPPGPVELRFVSNGTTSTLTIPDLRAGELVTVEVTLSGSSAVLTSIRRVDGGNEVVQGEIQTLVSPDGLTVAGRSITTNASTLFFANGQPTTYNALVVGEQVTVKGQATGSALLAAQIDIDSVIVLPEFPVIGVVANLQGTAAAFDFTVGGASVRGDAATIFQNGAQFTNLANGVSVQVQASQRTGFVYAVRIAISPGSN